MNASTDECHVKGLEFITISGRFLISFSVFK